MRQEEEEKDDDDDDDDDNVVKKQFFEADNIKQELTSPIHPSNVYKSQSINTRKITETLRSKDINSVSKIAEEEISQRIESVEITDD
ncbi:hypothetical protein F8M41_004339 [Gigaspora margarita]|uniref:Uncharacterized protein n=1 Tax=Gigaspora margarita TaxID=4874 RepID=A0A8H3X9U3_GIGMA|nr:hypothetical protein F8M41_017848 [Gigaspora margarita]KAF0437821.1 hypothetical protein F8M41_004339 [Gigaspora margarita]